MLFLSSVSLSFCVSHSPHSLASLSIYPVWLPLSVWMPRLSLFHLCFSSSLPVVHYFCHFLCPALSSPHSPTSVFLIARCVHFYLCLKSSLPSFFLTSYSLFPFLLTSLPRTGSYVIADWRRSKQHQATTCHWFYTLHKAASPISLIWQLGRSLGNLWGVFKST